MASEPAEPTTRPQDDRVGTVRRLGNSWFVKLVEPASEPWHVVCSRGLQKVSGWQSDEDMEDCPVVGYVPVAECVPGLLADPAQTTELEQLRAGGAKLLAVTEEFQQQRDLLLWLRAEAAWRVVGFDALTAALARHLKEAQAERDALSLLLRGMARKLVAARAELKQEKRDSAWVLNRIRRSLGTPDGRAVSVHAREVAAERDERQTRIEATTRRLEAVGWYARNGAISDALAMLRGEHVPKQWAPRAPLSGEALRDAEERDDASEETQ